LVLLKQEDFKNRLRSQNKDDEFTEVTACCDNPKINAEDGSVVCTRCGSVIERTMHSISVRAYTREEVEKRVQDAPLWRSFGPRTLLGKAGSHTDIKGTPMKSDVKTLFNRLTKINNSLISSIERNFWDAKPQMKMACSKLNIPTYIRETAWRIYQLCAKKKLTMGRSIVGFIAGALYIAIRVHEFPRLLDEVVEATIAPRRTIHKAMGLIIKDILPDMGLKYKPIEPIQLVYRFGSDLYLPMEIQQLAARILETSFRNGYSRVGKDPRGVASAVLYLASKSDHHYRKTQSEVCAVSKITEVTLRTRVADIRNHLR